MEARHVTASVDTKTELVAAGLHYTLAALPGDPATRKWLKQNAVIKQNRILFSRSLGRIQMGNIR